MVQTMKTDEVAHLIDISIFCTYAVANVLPKLAQQLTGGFSGRGGLLVSMMRYKYAVVYLKANMRKGFKEMASAGYWTSLPDMRHRLSNKARSAL